MRLSHLVSLVAVAFALAVQGGSAHAQVQTFKVDSSASSIQFVSDAPLEKFTGKSSTVTGEIKVDPEKPAGAKGDIQVPVATVKTGLSLRDEHLQADNWLDAKKYPNARFVVTKVSGVSALKPNESVDATVSGKFTIHGVTRDVTATAKVRYAPGAAGAGTLRIVGSFTVKLEDHKVSIPSIVALKVSPEIVVNVDISAKAG